MTVHKHLEAARTLAAESGAVNAHRVLSDVQRLLDQGGDAALAPLARESERCRRAMLRPVEAPAFGYIGAALGEG